MRDRRINVFYYPDMFVAPATLKKAILLFDELHFMDRPSFFFGTFGTVGASCPLRQVEASLREDGVPLFVHDAPGGSLAGTSFLEQIRIDVDDPLFLKRFQEGLERSATFRQFHIPPGNYGGFGDERNVAEKLIGVDLSKDMKGYGTASDLFWDDRIKPFDLSTPLGGAKHLVATAVICSAKLNYALKVSAERGFLPLADAGPYGDLLGAKYVRAINRLDPGNVNIQATDLTFAIFDELVSPERLDKLSFDQVIRYRKASEGAREDFLEYLSALQARQSGIGIDGDYAGVVERIVMSEIIPAARDFRNKLETIGDSLFGAMAKGSAAGAAALIGSSISFFGELSWEKIAAFAAATSAYMVKVGIDAILAERALRRECSISYILSLDD